jgi:hypothetical protein
MPYFRQLYNSSLLTYDNVLKKRNWPFFSEYVKSGNDFSSSCLLTIGALIRQVIQPQYSQTFSLSTFTKNLFARLFEL